MGQIIKPVCLCLGVRLRALSRSHLLMDLKTPKVKTSLLDVNITPPFTHFAPKKLLGEEILKMHVNINSNPITALHVQKLLEFSRLIRNLARRTRL